MKIAIVGASGFLGRSLLDSLGADYEVVPIFRMTLEGEDVALMEALKGCRVVINLAGSPIVGKRWWPKYRREIIKSRTIPAAKIRNCIMQMKEKPELYISASAIGIYANEGSHTENSTKFQKGFLTDVIICWEKEANAMQEFVERVVIMRLGVIISPQGGALIEMRKVFKNGMGAIIGNGKQIMPVISLEDFRAAVKYFIESSESQGIYNLVAPVKITNEEFSIQLASVFGKKVVFRMPGWCMRMVLGRGAVLLTDNKEVVPEKLMKEEFVFKHSSLKALLEY